MRINEKQEAETRKRNEDKMLRRRNEDRMLIRRKNEDQMLRRRRNEDQMLRRSKKLRPREERRKSWEIGCTIFLMMITAIKFNHFGRNLRFQLDLKYLVLVFFFKVLYLNIFSTVSNS